MPGLRLHLVALVLAVLLPALAFGAVVSWEALRGRDAANQSRLIDTAQALAATINSHIAGRLAALTVLAASPGLEDAGAPGFEDLARKTGEAFDGWVVVFERDGRPVLNTSVAAGTPLPGPGQGLGSGGGPWVQRVFATGQPQVTDLAVGRVSGQAVALVLVPILRGGEVWRVAGMPLVPARLSALLAGPMEGGPSAAALTDAGGTILAHSRDPARLVGQRRPPRADDGELGQGGILRGRSLADGTPIRTAFHRLMLAPGWMVWVNEPETAFESARRATLLALAGGGALALTIGLLLATALSRRLLAPVEALVARAEAVATGAGQMSAGEVPPAPVREFERLRQSVTAAERALRDGAQRQRLALEAAELGTWEVDLRYGIAIRDARMLEIFGIEKEGAFGPYPAWQDHVHPDDRAGLAEALEGVRRGKSERSKMTYRFHRPDGQWRWVECYARAAERQPATGEALRLIGTAQDVTARREAEDRQALLAREVDHRAKNALAVVQAALRLTPRDDPARFVEAIEGRVMALARAHTLLAQGHWAGAELQSVLEGELTPFQGASGPWARCNGPRLSLTPAAVQALSMAFHELATNAAKYGALSQPGGVVEVVWEVVEEPAGPALHLCWRELGGPAAPTPPSRRGFGSSLVEATVARQLGGRLLAEWPAEGLVWQAWLPLKRIQSGA
ncbi:MULTISPECIES: HWE histidine kinase domain-containing protein [Roseomonadaceae]|uniref:histidine kinase n=1 Tax=Falsiroseomonas oleicola TaxID=2801474 RepID=A0ABS6H8W4_9PROT|nr:HWE histidine kinase domain-containing protein [Roseomonas oleicola]MBU8544163.1 PAS domain-containing protein [Roseomonas oleicola]